MAKEFQLHDPWLIAVWPGMGHVAISAGYYLMAKLGMHVISELPAREFFEIEHVEVKGGLIRTGRLPRSQFFVWNDPDEKRDVIIFIGEAQPPIGKYVFCRRLIDFARELGVNRVFTFAAMATQMHPQQDCRVFGAATDMELLSELRQLDLEVVEDGNIGGLNGVLLGAAADAGLRGACLLGEMPQIFTQLPFPKASLAVLRVFTTMAALDIDFTELSEQAHEMEQKLGEILEKVESAIGQQAPPEEEEFGAESTEDQRLSEADENRIDQLFKEARANRSKAYELKKVLDRLDVFHEFEDRFLDLFKKRT